MRTEVKMMDSAFQLKPCPGSRTNIFIGPETAPTSKSAIVRFIIRYVVRLRKWRFLAKATRVKALIITIPINSLRKTVGHAFSRFFKEESSAVLLAMLQ